MGGRNIYFFFRNESYTVSKLFSYCLEVIPINKIPKSKIISLRFFLIKSLINILTRYLYALGFCKAALYKAAFMNFKTFNLQQRWLKIEYYVYIMVICNLMAVEYIALYTHQALEQKSLTLDLAIAVLHSLQRAICCSHTQKKP